MEVLVEVMEGMVEDDSLTQMLQGQFRHFPVKSSSRLKGAGARWFSSSARPPL